MYDRDDALRLAQALYRKQEIEKRTGSGRRFPRLPELLAHGRGPVGAKFSNPDITYLVKELKFKPRFIGQMIGWFGEGVVLEALRRVADYEFNKEAYFVGVCRNVEKERKGSDSSV